jgi:hypothetical protein
MPTITIAERGPAHVLTCNLYTICEEQLAGVVADPYNTGRCIESNETRRVILSNETNEFGVFDTLWIEVPTFREGRATGELVEELQFLPADEISGPAGYGLDVVQRLEVFQRLYDERTTFAVSYQFNREYADGTSMDVYISRWRHREREIAVMKLEKIVCGFPGDHP